jgi:hypothetical protein
MKDNNISTQMDTLKEGSRCPDVIFLQALLGMTPTGTFGSATKEKLIEFQGSHNLTADGICGPQTWTALRKQNPYTGITEESYKTTAASLGISVAALKAVCEVETSGSGQDTSGRPKCLFEGHIFWAALKKRGVDPSKITGHSGVLYKTWTKGKYLGGYKEWDRLKEAAGINFEAALESASLGLFQIMGNNWKAAGAGSVVDYYAKTYMSAQEQLGFFAAYIKSQGLTKYLVNLDWAGFAKRYNGSGYAENKYDTRLAQAYKKYKS